MTARREAILPEFPHDFENPALLERALTHRSYSREHNENLEWLGDTVLALIVSELLLERMPESDEGRLTVTRNALVSNLTLAEIAQHLGVGPRLRIGVAEERNDGRTKQSILADTFEALVGAVFLDGGYGAVRSVLSDLLSERLEDAASTGVEMLKDSKTRLNECLGLRGGAAVRYDTEECGENAFRSSCWVGDELVADGSGNSKRAAEQDAATAALKRLGKA